MDRPDEEGRWEGRRRMTENGHHTGGGDDNENYTPPPSPAPPEVEASSGVELQITFRLRGEEAVATVVRYN